ncbi:DUF4174 domain-containing protein [Pseudocnuella soli]|uniref:DUF4174 domain-containing protein n=1 Tax=Pseudocnuella soli TaxID=2502779 RepID=UPI00104A0842|nr:DUF4174 domain-containing protein [Pseudocnuella soli]
MRIILFIISIFIMSNAAAQFSKKRALFIFGDPKSETVKEQLALLKKEAAGVNDRDLNITTVAGEEKRLKKYEVAPNTPFTIILVGKDGGEKFRSEKLTQPSELFNIIDAMPMRQSEMRRNKKEQ